MRSALEKGVSLFIAFIFLFANTFPVYAQGLKGPRRLESAPTPIVTKKQSKNIDNALVQKKKAAEEQISEVEKASRVVGTDCLIPNEVPPMCVISDLQLVGANPDKPQKEICVKGANNTQYCGPSIAAAQGGIHRIVLNRKGLYTNGKAIKRVAGDMLNLISSWGVYQEEGNTKGDVAVLRQYFYDVTSTITCGKSGWTAAGIPQITAVQNQHCAQEVDALIGIALLAKKFGNEAEKKRAIATIVHYLNKAWKSSDGATVITGAVSALVLLGAWNNIDNFLTNVAKPEVNRGAHLLDLVSVNWVATNIYAGSQERARNATRYYNETNEGFSYVDENTCAANPKTFGKAPYQKVGIQYPYTNSFEEIGHIIGAEVRDNQSTGAGKLARKIMWNAIQYAKNPYKSRTYYDDYGKAIVTTKTKSKMDFYGHWPVVVGILSASDTYPGYIVPNGEKEGMYKLIILLMGDFWDINAGTQTRIRRIVARYYNALAKENKGLATYGGEKFKEKAKQYNMLKKTKAGGEMADTALLLFSLPGMLAAGPAIGRGIWSTVKGLRRGVSRMGSKAWKVTKQTARNIKKEARIGGKSTPKVEAKAPGTPSTTPVKKPSASVEEPMNPRISRTEGSGVGGERVGAQTPHLEGNVTGEEKVLEFESPAVKNSNGGVSTHAAQKEEVTARLDNKVKNQGDNVVHGSWYDNVVAFADGWVEGTRNMAAMGIPIPTKKLNFQRHLIQRVLRKGGIEIDKVIFVERINPSRARVSYLGPEGVMTREVELSAKSMNKLEEIAFENVERIRNQEALSAGTDAGQGTSRAGGTSGTSTAQDARAAGGSSRAARGAAAGDRQVPNSFGFDSNGNLEVEFVDAQGQTHVGKLSRQDLVTLVSGYSVRTPSGTFGKETLAFLDEVAKKDKKLANLLKETRSQVSTYQGHASAMGTGAKRARTQGVRAADGGASDPAQGAEQLVSERKAFHEQRHQNNLQQESSGSMSELERADLRLKNRTEEYKEILKDDAWKRSDPEGWRKAEESAYLEMANASEAQGKIAKAAERKAFHEQRHQNNLQQESSGSMSELERANLRLKNRTEEYKEILKDDVWKRSDPEGWKKAEESASLQMANASEAQGKMAKTAGRESFGSAERPSHVQNSTSPKKVEPQPELSPIQFVKQGSQSFSQASGKIIQDARPLHEGVPALEHDISLLEGQAFRQFPQRGTVSTVAQQYRTILRSEPIENIVNAANRLAPTLNRTEKIMDDAVAALETGSKENLANLTQKLDAQINELQAIRVELDNSVSAAQQTIAKFRPGPEYVDYTEVFKPLEQNLSSYLEVGSGVSNDINTLIKDLTAIKAQLLKVK